MSNTTPWAFEGVVFTLPLSHWRKMTLEDRSVQTGSLTWERPSRRTHPHGYRTSRQEIAKIPVDYIRHT